MASFKEGDIVQLKSGGPKMTVVHVLPGSPSSYYDCKWFAGSKLSQGRFSADSLQPYIDVAPGKK